MRVSDHGHSCHNTLRRLVKCPLPGPSKIQPRTLLIKAVNMPIANGSQLSSPLQLRYGSLGPMRLYMQDGITSTKPADVLPPVPDLPPYVSMGPA
jgi:hypothetical protein